MLSKHANAAAAVPFMDRIASPAARAVAGEALWKGMQIAATGLPLIAATAAGVSGVVEKMTAANRKAQAYKSMMVENPHLQDRDPTLVQKYFNTLHNLNPTLATDPTVAASFVNNMVMTNNPATPHRDIYMQALQLQRGGGPGGGGGATDHLQNISKAFADVHRGLAADKTDALRADLAASREETAEQTRRKGLVQKYVKSKHQEARAAANESEKWYHRYVDQHEQNERLQRALNRRSP